MKPLNRLLKIAFLPGCLLLGANRSWAISVTPSDDALLLANTVSNGLTITGATFTGASGTDDFFEFNSQAGIFTNGTDAGSAAAGIEFEEGIVLTTGWAGWIDDLLPNYNNPDDPPPPPGSAFLDDLSQHHGTAGDSDLDALAGGATADAAVLAFTFESEAGILSFDYIFASEEYEEFVEDEFNDVFGLYLDGVNIATLPDLTPVGVTTVNESTNDSFYRTNVGESPTPLNIEFDGLTVVMTAEAFVTAGTHTIEFKIADKAENEDLYLVDSAVFIDANSVSIETAPLPTSAWAGLSLLGVLALARFRARRRLA